MVSIKKYLLSGLLSLSVLLISNNASALSYSGKDFEKILSVYSRQEFGYWAYSQKFYSYVNNDNHIKADPINKVTFKDSSLNGISFSSVLAMGTTTESGTVNSSKLSTDLDTGNVTVYGSRGEVLLTAEYSEAGLLNATYKNGLAGELGVSGIFNVTGGSLFASGLITNPLYIDIAFTKVYQNEYKDLKTRWGTYTFYQQIGSTPPPTTPPGSGGNPIPEPASIALLGGSLIGLVRNRRKKQISE